ncbi:hypothetical protein O9K51_02897 [Purpureocillium lavendulum]|uniref:Uncharacterized protein n=1 Tax=Purpureocillium lavendulum TaxID=1247861 RepID=A0AB34FZN9_9HYPO|nr:hypothetical protein O9K51_02897 [Purpureocillium lavendulum]
MSRGGFLCFRWGPDVDSTQLDSARVPSLILQLAQLKSSEWWNQRCRKEARKARLHGQQRAPAVDPGMAW